MANKKILGFVLALAVAVGSFAVPVVDTGLSIGGKVTTGVQFGGAQQDGDTSPYNTQGKGTMYSKFYSDDADNGTPLRAEVNFLYSKENQGARVRIRVENGAFGLKNAYGWTGLFGGMVKLSAGHTIDDVWGTSKGSEGNWVDSNLEDSRGLRLEFVGVPNLTVGVSAFAEDLAVLGSVKPIDHLKFTTIGGAYKMDGLFKASFAMTFNAAKGGQELENRFTQGIKKRVFDFWDYTLASPSTIIDSNDPTSTGSGPSNYGDPAAIKPGKPYYDHTSEYGLPVLEDAKYFRALFGASFLGVDKLTVSADADFAFSSLKDQKFNRVRGYLFGSYALGTILDSVSLYAGADTYTYNNGTTDEDDKVAGILTFRVTPALKFSEKLSAELRVQFDLDAFENSAYKKLNGDDEYKGGYTFAVRPRVNVNFGGGMSFYTYLDIASDLGRKTSAADVKPVNSQTLQMEFTYTF